MAENDDDYLARIRDDFRQAADFEASEREAMVDDLRFVRLGGTHQWPIYAQQARNQPGEERPMLTDNRVRQYRTSVINGIKESMPAIKVRPVDDKADVKAAEVLQGVIRNIEAMSHADVATEKALEYAVDCGRGYFGLMTRYVSDDAWDQEVAFRVIPDPFRVYLDPWSVEPDGSDARWAFLVEELPREAVEKEYPDITLSDWDVGSAGDVDGWISKDSVRIAEHFEIVSTPMDLVLLADGRTLWADELEEMTQQAQGLPPVQSTRKSARRRCVWTKIAGVQVVDRRELPTQYVPVVPVFGDEFWLEGKRYISGIVRPAKDPQRLFNFWMSAVAEQVALQPKIPWIVPEGALEGHEDMWKQANNRNFSYLQYVPQVVNGVAMPGPQRQPPPPIPTGYVEQMQTALDGIKAAVGMQDPAIGAQETANQSGRAIRSLQMQAAIGTAHFAHNLAKSMAHAGRIILEMIPHVYDTRRVLRILGEDGTADHATHDPMAPQAVTQQPDPLTGAINKIYNLSLGRYDVRVDIGPTYGTRRQEGFDSLTQLAQQVPVLGQVAPDLIVRLSDSPYADEMADRLKATLPPPVLAVVNADEDQAPDPQLLAAQDQINQMGAAIQQLQQQLAEAQSDQGAKMAEIQVKQADVQGSLEAKANELALKAQEIALKKQELDIKQFEAETRRLESILSNEHAIADRDKEDADDADERDAEAAEMAMMTGIAQSVSDLQAQIEEHRAAVEGLRAQHEQAHQTAMTGLADVLHRAQPAVSVRALRDADGRLIGAVKTRADGLEETVRIQ